MGRFFDLFLKDENREMVIEKPPIKKPCYWQTNFVTIGTDTVPLSLLYYKIHHVRLCCLRNDKMIVLVSSNTGTQRKITRAVITKYYALSVRNEMRTVRT